MNISETTGYLLVQVARAHRAKAQELLAKHGLYPGQEILLMHLCDCDGLMHSEIARLLDVTPATVSRIVDRMEAGGLVQRQADADDQRVSRVYLSADGRKLIEPSELVWGELERESFVNMTAEERVLLRRLLMQVLKNLT
ncbi:MAG TPA: MarR family transcriptional regulator [Thermoleophilia bacterium]|nr:MarR family transcriptional regulator [Thermoleophilia bacterium]